MSARTMTLSLLLVAAATALSIGLSSAQAATSVTVKAGSTISGSTIYPASSTGTSPQWVVTDLVNGETVGCASATLSGRLPGWGRTCCRLQC